MKSETSATRVTERINESKVNFWKITNFLQTCFQKNKSKVRNEKRNITKIVKKF